MEIPKETMPYSPLHQLFCISDNDIVKKKVIIGQYDTQHLFPGFLFQHFGRGGPPIGGEMAHDAFLTFDNAMFKSVYKLMVCFHNLNQF